MLGKDASVKSKVAELPETLAIVPTGSFSKLIKVNPARLEVGVVASSTLKIEFAVKAPLYVGLAGSYLQLKKCY